MKKKIIHFIHEIGDGGASTLVKDYSLLLKKEGYEPIVVVTFPAEDTSNYQIIKDNGIELVHLYPKRSFFWKTINKICPIWFLSRKLFRIIKSKEPLAIHAHLAVLQYIAPIRKSLKCKIVYTCHSIPEKYLTNGSAETKAANVLIRDNDLLIIALHDAMREEINRYFGIQSALVVTNGIDLNRYQSVKKSRGSIRKEHGIPKNAFVIGHVGRFVEVKNHIFLIDIFNEVIKINDNCFLLMVGSGPNEDIIRKKLDELHLSERFLILSHRTDIPELMKAMDAFVLPSKYEGFSLVSIEAQVSGLRYITTTTIPNEAIVSKNAVILSLEEPLSVWAESILKAIPCSEDKLADYSKYDLLSIIKKLEKIYEERNCFYEK